MIRLDKYLAHAKLGTRKEVKKLIRAGFIEVNGVVCRYDDQKIDEITDTISYDGETIAYTDLHYIMLHKPAGYLSSTLDEHYPSVLHLIDEDYSYDLFPIGRLDVDTEGLLLLSNDGKLSHALLSPRHHVEKEYEVEIQQGLSQMDKERLETGVSLDDVVTKPCQVEIIKDKQIKMVLHEGKFHQIKRMLHAVDNEVVYLKRIRMGALWLDPNLELGEYRPLTKTEVALLKGANK